MWWPTFLPGLMILLTVLSLNILSEGLTDALAALSQRGAKVEEAPTRENPETEGRVLGQTSSAVAAEALAESLSALKTHE